MELSSHLAALKDVPQKLENVVFVANTAGLIRPNVNILIVACIASGVGIVKNMEGLQFVGLRDVQTMFRVRGQTVFVEGMGPSFQCVKQKIVIDP